MLYIPMTRRSPPTKAISPPRTVKRQQDCLIAARPSPRESHTFFGCSTRYIAATSARTPTATLASPQVNVEGSRHAPWTTSSIDQPDVSIFVITPCKSNAGPRTDRLCRSVLMIGTGCPARNQASASGNEKLPLPCPTSSNTPRAKALSTSGRGFPSAPTTQLS